MFRFQIIRHFVSTSSPLKSVSVSSPSKASQRLHHLRLNFDRALAINSSLQYRSLSTSATTFFAAKTFVQVENSHSLSLIQKDPKYENLLFNADRVLSSVTEQKINLSQVTNDFINASLQPDTELKPLDHECHLNLISKLVSSISSLSDTELLLILDAMRRFPRSESPKSENFLRLWKSIDGECVARTKSGIWSVNEVFVMDDAWYPLDLSRFSSFHWELIKRCFRKCGHLDKEQFVRFLFCLNRTRKIHDSINTYELEFNLKRLFTEMTAEELCVVSLALFKTQTPIRNMKLLGDLMSTVSKSSESLQSISVAGISKIIRLSVRYCLHEEVHNFLSAFSSQVDRLSIAACIHLGLVGTSNNVYHKELIAQIIEKVENDIAGTRVKEMEKLLFITSSFNISAPTLFDKILNEYRNPSPEREKEIEEYGRSLPCIVHYLTHAEIYPVDLIDKVLDRAYTKKYYGKNLYHLQREMLCVDIMAETDIPNYTGNRLTDRARNYLLKYTTFWINPKNGDGDKSKITHFVGCFQSICNTIQDVFDARGKTFTGSILPQYHTVGVLFCTDKNGNAVDIPDYITKADQYKLKLIQNNDAERFVFHSFALGGRHNFIHGTNELLGKALIQERQLTKLGFVVHQINSLHWISLSDEERKTLIKNLILTACEKERSKSQK